MGWKLLQNLGLAPVTEIAKVFTGPGGVKMLRIGALVSAVAHPIWRLIFEGPVCTNPLSLWRRGLQRRHH